MNESLVTFVPLKETDLKLMWAWRNEPHVRLWWGDEGQGYESVAKEYLPLIQGTEPTLGYLIRYDDQPIGFIQTYRIDDYPEYKSQIAIEEKAAGVDIFIGDTNFIGKGLGAKIIRRFAREIVFVEYDVRSCIADPATRNVASVKAFQNAGFAYLKDAVDPETGECETLLRLPRS